MYCYNPVTCEILKGYTNEPVYTGVTYKDNSGKNVDFRYVFTKLTLKIIFKKFNLILLTIFYFLYYQLDEHLSQKISYTYFYLLFERKTVCSLKIKI